MGQTKDLTPSSRPGAQTSHGSSSCDQNNDISETKPLGNNLSVVEAKKVTEAEIEYPKSSSLVFVLLGLCFSTFLLSADRTIVATALPYISKQFHSFPTSGWYASAYLLTSSALQPSFGRIFQQSDLKWTFIVSVLIFAIGSILCAAAPNSGSFIAGRAVTGIGSAGMLSGAYIIIAYSVPLEKRPVYQAAIGMSYAIGSVFGPLLGGAFTSRVTWRWCFWINLPICALTIATILGFLKSRKHTERSNLTWRQRMLSLDIVGSVLFASAGTMFLLALQFADAGRSWSDSAVIGLLTGSPVTFLVFGGWQFWLGEQALVPPSIVCRRTVAFAVANAFFLYATLMVHVYDLSIWFQSVRFDSALHAGVHLLAYIAPCAFAVVLGGVVTGKTGYFAPPAWIGCALATCGAGLLTTLRPNEPTANWVGYLFLSGFGVGLAGQQGFTAVQVVLPFEHIHIGTAVVSTSQTFGAAVSVYVGNSIIIQKLRNASIPGVNILLAIATAGLSVSEGPVPMKVQETFVTAFNTALKDVFIYGTVAAGIAFLTSLGLEMRSVRGTGSDERGEEMVKEHQ